MLNNESFILNESKVKEQPFCCPSGTYKLKRVLKPHQLFSGRIFKSRVSKLGSQYHQ